MTNPITDEMLDRLSDGLRAIAAETDNAVLRDIASELAIDRGALAEFAVILRKHDTPASAIRELVV